MQNAEGALSEEEAAALFAPLLHYSRLVVAVSGGPDSTALLWLLQRWAKTVSPSPHLHVATVDHALRPEAAGEAASVAALAQGFGLPHETLVWSGEKPKTGIQKQARMARERLLVGYAEHVQASAIVLAHHQDDQAETVLMRMAAGSGLSGLKGMGLIEGIEGSVVVKLRPLLGVSKARLVATCQAAGLSFVDEPSNASDAFARVRLRKSAEVLAREGLTPLRLQTLARRLRQADEALEAAVEAALAGPLVRSWPDHGTLEIDASHYDALPQAIRLRVVLRALARRQTEGQAELAEAERLESWLEKGVRGRRTLAGVLVTRNGEAITFQTAPLRRKG